LKNCIIHIPAFAPIVMELPEPSETEELKDAEADPEVELEPEPEDPSAVAPRRREPWIETEEEETKLRTAPPSTMSFDCAAVVTLLEAVVVPLNTYYRY
jgi:hypothetical protein